jgi:23S rRNA pseudouridine2604 synthase
MDEKIKEADSLTKIRINKYLSDAGICSRREADRLIEAGQVTINGCRAKAGDRIGLKDQVLVEGRPINKEQQKVLLLFNKPRGLVCSTKQQRQEITVTDYIDYPIRIYPVGRLDKDSEGLLLLTNQGELVNKIMRAGNRHEKEYQVTVDRPVDALFVKQMSKGVPILDTVTRPCFVEKTGHHSFRIILTQGLNRQIRRMCEYFGYHVTSLKRVRIMNLTLSGIREGQYRKITESEWKELEKMLESSYSSPIEKERNRKTGGHHGESHTANERTGRAAEPGRKSLLSGRQGDHEQSGVRPPLRRASEAGGGNRNRSGKQSDSKRGVRGAYPASKRRT